MSSLALSELEEDESILQQSPESLRARALSPPLHDLLNSTSEISNLNIDTDDDFPIARRPVKQCTSSRSSISSFPASVIHTTLFTDHEDFERRTPSLSRTNDSVSKSIGNSYLSAFRHPSSVRALQLESEYADSDTLSVRNPRPKKSPKVSYFNSRSPGSIHSSPSKRSSRPATPTQRGGSKLKKEFPLVLLHCNLLPPAATTHGSTVPEEVLEAVLPEQYRKRWKTLQDKVTKNSEVRQRGVLIPHPREDYDQLEETLLETLELERPRIRKGHYLGSRKSGDSDSGFESSSQNDTDEASDAEGQEDKDPCDKCPDCGNAVSCNIEQDRRWEVKVFAANGLMRGGAWSAAWEEMEKVDVQVGVWMPEEVRAEVEERLKALQAKEEPESATEEATETTRKRTRSNTAKLRHDERMREIYGDNRRATMEDKTQSHAKTSPTSPQPELYQSPMVVEEVNHDQESKPQLYPTSEFPNTHPPQQVIAQEDFLTFVQRHLSLLWNDQKNLAIVLLSILVLFFSFQNTGINQPASRSDQGAAISSSAPQQAATPSEQLALSYITTTVYASSTELRSVSIGHSAQSVSAVESSFSTTSTVAESSTSSTSNSELAMATIDKKLDAAPEAISHNPAAEEQQPSTADDMKHASKALSVADSSPLRATETLNSMPTEDSEEVEVSHEIDSEQSLGGNEPLSPNESSEINAASHSILSERAQVTEEGVTSKLESFDHPLIQPNSEQDVLSSLEQPMTECTLSTPDSLEFLSLEAQQTSAAWVN